MSVFILVSQVTKSIFQSIILIIAIFIIFRSQLTKTSHKWFSNTRALILPTLFSFVAICLEVSRGPSHILEGLDHDNVFHFFASTNLASKGYDDLPSEFSYLPNGWHKSASQILMLTNLDQFQNGIVAYQIISVLSLLFFNYAVTNLMQNTHLEQALRNSRHRVLVQFWSFVITAGWGFWLYWVGSIPYLYGLSLTIFGASKLIEMLNRAKLLDENKKLAKGAQGILENLGFTAVLLGASTVCWPPLAIVNLGLVLITSFQLQLSTLKSQKFSMKQVGVLSIPIFATVTSVIGSRKRLGSESYPIFASDGVSGVGEYNLMMLIFGLLICYLAINKSYEINKTMRSQILQKNAVLYSVLGIGIAITIELGFGLIARANTRYYSQKLLLPLELILTILVIGFLINSETFKIKYRNSSKKFVSSALIVSSLTVSFPWGTPEWGLPMKGAFSSPQTISIAPGIKQIYHQFVLGKASNPLMNGEHLLSVAAAISECQITYPILYLDQTAPERIGSELYSNYWLSALLGTDSTWRVAKNFAYENNITLKTLKGMSENQIQTLQTQNLGIILISESTIKYVKSGTTKLSLTSERINSCLKNRS